jgi:Ca2+-binding EF-hand superfamily protein
MVIFENLCSKGIYIIYFYRDKIRDNYDDFNKAFRKYDTEKRGSLSINEIQKVLIDFNLFLDDEQFFTLLDR